MYREEILDMAMDILDNTDATLEEAMGIAIESAENKMSDADKYRRRRLKADGAAIAAARPGKYEGLSAEARGQRQDSTGKWVYDKGPARVSRIGNSINHGNALKGYNNDGYNWEIPKRRNNAANSAQRSYPGMSPDQKRKIDREIDRYSKKQDRLTSKMRSEYTKKNPTFSELERFHDDEYGTSYRRVRDARKNGVPTNTVTPPRFKGSTSTVKDVRYRPNASKEAAIMDTALDFLDMYDVSLEEAIDMAYDYIG